MAGETGEDMETVMRQIIKDGMPGWTYEGVKPFTRSDRGLAVTVLMAALSGANVTRQAIYNWLRSGRLATVGYVCSPKKGQRLPVFWSGDLDQLIAALPPSRYKYAPGTSGNPKGRPTKARVMTQQTLT